MRISRLSASLSVPARAVTCSAFRACALVTSAVESVDDEVLVRLEKGHTAADFERAVDLMRTVGLPLAPTFVTFTPWTTRDGYVDLLDTIERLDLVEHVAPIQWTIRLLIPSGSRLLELDDVGALVGDFDPAALAYPWRHPDRQVDVLHRRVASLVGRHQAASRGEMFDAVRTLAISMSDEPAGARPRTMPPRTARAAVPYLTEPWYC